MSDDSMETRCLLHANIASRQAVMKGLNRDMMADALMLEAIKLAFGLSDVRAAKAAMKWKQTIFRELDADYIGRLPDGSARPVRLSQRATRASLLGNSAFTRAA